MTIRGRGNRLQVERPFLPNTASLTLLDGATVLLKEDSNLNDLVVHAGPGAWIEIGAWCSFISQCAVTAHERATILIGDHCLFGASCKVMSSDVHKIVDRTSRRRLNPAGDIIIGDHVWVAPNSLILRNTILGRQSIVGAGSIVRHAFASNVLVAGAPARIVRRNVDWEF